MEDNTPLPVYTSSAPEEPIRGSEPLPPSYTPPTRFTIGQSTTTKPLVQIKEIKGHLALLHAFAELKKQVEASEFSGLHVLPNAESKWIWFVGLAVERFDRWCQRLEAGDASKGTEEVLPPIDVIMVWHAYMLNPRWYAEDCLRIRRCQKLKTLEKHFTSVLSDPSLLSGSPSKARLDFWRSRTHSMPFDHLECMPTLVSRTLTCPTCQSPTEVELMNKGGTGYLQQGFTAACRNPGCQEADITKTKLAHYKLAWDLAARPLESPTSHLAGTFFPKTTDAEKGNKAKSIICLNAQPFLSDNPPISHFPVGSKDYQKLMTAAIMKYQDTLVNLRTQIAIRAPGRLLGRIMNAYNDDKIYSVELVGAVLRQGTFVKKMNDLGWTTPGYFHGAEDELALHHSLARYHAFLDLMTTSPVSFFVPTLDIDLVWHTHQLMPSQYEADNATYLKRFIDHDDKVEGLRLSSAFDITCRAWKDRFNVSYTHCGCPVPGDTIGQRLSRMVGVHSNSEPPSHLVPADRSDLLAATHPSDHNAVRFLPQSEKAHKAVTKRYEDLAKKKQKEVEKAAKKLAKQQQEQTQPKGRPASIISFSNKEKKEKEKIPIAIPLHNSADQPGGSNTRRGAYAHDTAFLVPVPLFFGAGLYGYGVGGFGGGCVSSGGGVMVSNVAGSCSSCGSGGICGAGGCGGAGVGGGCGGGGGDSIQIPYFCSS